MGIEELILGGGVSHPRPLRHPSKPPNPAETHMGVARVQGGVVLGPWVKPGIFPNCFQHDEVWENKLVATWTTWDVYAGMSWGWEQLQAFASSFPIPALTRKPERGRRRTCIRWHMRDVLCKENTLPASCLHLHR